MSVLAKIVAAAIFGPAFAMLSNFMIAVGLGSHSPSPVFALSAALCLVAFMAAAPSGRLAWSRGLFVTGLALLAFPLAGIAYSAQQVAAAPDSLSAAGAAAGSGAAVLVLLVVCVLGSAILCALAFSLSRRA